MAHFNNNEDTLMEDYEDNSEYIDLKHVQEVRRLVNSFNNNLYDLTSVF